MQLIGLKGAAAYQTYLRVLFYLRLVRESIKTEKKSFDELVDELSTFDEEKKKTVFLELMAISPMSDRDVLRLCAVHKDENGVSYSNMNIDNLNADQIMRLCLETLIACSKTGEDVFF